MGDSPFQIDPPREFINLPKQFLGFAVGWGVLGQTKLNFGYPGIDFGQTRIELEYLEIDSGQTKIDLRYPAIEVGYPEIDLGKTRIDLGYPGIDFEQAGRVLEWVRADGVLGKNWAGPVRNCRCCRSLRGL